jgi:hypothetical protein
MVPVRWDVRQILATCPNGHSYSIESAFDFAAEAPDDAETAPAVVQMPTRCPKCTPSKHAS